MDRVTETDDERVGEKVMETERKQLMLTLMPEEIDIVHGVEKKSQEKTRGILVKFVSHKIDKEENYEKGKNR